MVSPTLWGIGCVGLDATAFGEGGFDFWTTHHSDRALPGRVAAGLDLGDPVILVEPQPHWQWELRRSRDPEPLAAIDDAKPQGPDQVCLAGAVERLDERHLVGERVAIDVCDLVAQNHPGLNGHPGGVHLDDDVIVIQAHAKGHLQLHRPDYGRILLRPAHGEPAAARARLPLKAFWTQKLSSSRRAVVFTHTCI